MMQDAKKQIVHELRIQLPPLDMPHPTPVQFFWRMRSGPWQAGHSASLELLAGQFRAGRLSACLHPADVACVTLSLPALARPLLLKAARQAVAARALNPVEDLLLALGPRSDNGQADLAWSARHTVQQHLHALRQLGLPLKALYPPQGRPDLAHGQIQHVDGWTLRPASPQHLDILPPGHPDSAQATASPDRFDIAAWSFPLTRPAEPGRSHWPRVLAGWTLIALLILLIGLHRDARRLAEEGQQLKQGMTQRVKAAFPDLGIVLDPLQQARQQLANRQQTDDATKADLASLVHAAAPLLASAAGQFQTLDYRNETLVLSWRDGALPAENRLAALREQAAHHPLSLSTERNTLRITAAPTAPEPAP